MSQGQIPPPFPGLPSRNFSFQTALFGHCSQLELLMISVPCTTHAQQFLHKCPLLNAGEVKFSGDDKCGVHGPEHKVG